MRSEWVSKKANLRAKQAMLSGEVTIYGHRPADELSTPEDVQFDLQMDDIRGADYENNHDVSFASCNIETKEDLQQWLGLVVSHSPTAQKLWLRAARQEWKITLQNLHNNGYQIDVSDKTIILDDFSMSLSSIGRSSFFKNTFIMNLLKALRDVWHETTLGGMEAFYRPEDVLMIERVRAADCDTVALLCAWELRGAGFSELWRSVIGSAEGDMALTFTSVLERDPSAFIDGAALTHAFRQWFDEHERSDSCDHDVLEMLDDLVLSGKGPSALGRGKVKPSDLEAIAVLPDGICYLQGYGETIKSDPYFAGLHDQINQSHLFHMVYDMDVTVVSGVPFRDRELGRLIFPDAC
jgi:hypothetical protein